MPIIYEIRNSKCLSESAEWNESRLAKLLLCFMIVNDSISKLIMLTYNVTDRLSLVSLVPPIVFFSISFCQNLCILQSILLLFHSTKINKQKMLYGQKYRNTYITTHLRTKKYK